MDGKPRELHTALAAEALDFHVEDEYRTQYSDVAGRANRIIDSPYFSVRVTEMTSSFHRNLIKYDSFIISMCIKGDCTIRMVTKSFSVKGTARSFLLPLLIMMSFRYMARRVSSMPTSTIWIEVWAA